MSDTEREVSMFSNRNINYLLLAVIVAIFIFTGLYLYMFNSGLSSNMSDWEGTGDYFGGIVGTILNLVAVVLIYVTYRLQQEELKKTSNALRIQNEQAKLQQFRDTVFRLLARKDHLIQNLHYINHKNQGHQGSRVFDGLIKTFKEHLKGNLSINELEEAKNIIRSYLHLYISSITYLDNYKINKEEERKEKEDLVRIYSSNLIRQEKVLLELIFKNNFITDADIPELSKGEELSNKLSILE